MTAHIKDLLNFRRTSWHTLTHELNTPLAASRLSRAVAAGRRRHPESRAEGCRR